MRTPIGLIFAACFAAIGFFATVQTSSAMPVAPAGQTNAGGLVQDIRWGCPRGWAPNRWGRCVRHRPYWRPRHYYRPYYRPYYRRHYYRPHYRHYYRPRYYHHRGWGGGHRRWHRW
ncbi:hypothetical protein [Labrys sp. La1]|uniref:hypothetical protein n=1 Tax=Labrys sp. La1 TaxID=3404917 RepID=UPI003EBE1E71